jgi:membrane-associated phospholipid phosphatase
MSKSPEHAAPSARSSQALPVNGREVWAPTLLTISSTTTRPAHAGWGWSHEPSKPSRHFFPEALALLAFLGFLLLTECLGRLEWQDTYVATLLDGLRGDQACPFTIWFTGAAPFLATTLVGIGAVVALARGATLMDVCRVLVLLAVGLLLVEGVKLLIDRERPGGLFQHPTASGSFPSGHVANAALCVASAITLVHRLRGQRDFVRAAMIGAGSLFVLAVAFTRVYLGLHWLSDVTGSMLLGLSFGAVLSAPPMSRRRFLAALGLVGLPLLYLAAACGVRVPVLSPAAHPRSVQGQLGQSMFGRRTGYESMNDAPRGLSIGAPPGRRRPRDSRSRQAATFAASIDRHCGGERRDGTLALLVAPPPVRPRNGTEEKFAGAAAPSGELGG